MIIEYQEGMENWDIPYFEEMKSVQAPGITMTGKNLFDVNSETKNKTIDLNNGVVNFDAYNRNTSDYIRVLPGDYIANTYMTRLSFYDKNKKYITSGTNKTTFTVSGDICYIRFSYDNSVTNIQLEKGSTATPYEPYKSTTLSTPSDLELRKVGEVQDELNVMTGEVTERVGEVVLDGSENGWSKGSTKTNTQVFSLRADENAVTTINGNNNNNLNCDKLVVANGVDKPLISFYDHNIYIGVLKKNASTVEELKQYLQTNPITVQYELITPIIKTVPLTIVNQDGNETKLRTFDDTTHVLLDSEGLIPTAALTVKTKIPSASSMSLMMDDISTEQQQLESTVDEQSNNVDATMIATTEIYEETL